MKIDDPIIKESKDYVKSIFDANKDKNLYYHNWDHTQHVYNTTIEISNSEPSLSDMERECLELAAIFHDVAYFKGKENHEQNGASLAKEFLSETFPKEKIALIERIILATKMGHHPTDLLEQIIQDADLSHLGNKDYMSSTYENLLAEINCYCAPQLSEKEWRNMSINFMEKHQYHTTYAKEHFQEQKLKNIQRLKNMDQATQEANKKLPVEQKKGKKKKNGDKAKSNIPEKGIETMFRVALRNHVNLSRIADNKANTLISVNAIIISIVLSTMFPKMDNNPYLIYPGLALIIFSITTIIFGILSTIPKTTHGNLSRDEVKEKKGNLIFFGNFHKMSLEDYEWGIQELMKDKDYLYKSLTRDLYFLGKVLNKKYNLLRYGYFIFVTGLLTSIILFAYSLRLMY